jgi:ribosomal protein S27AE
LVAAPAGVALVFLAVINKKYHQHSFVQKLKSLALTRFYSVKSDPLTAGGMFCHNCTKASVHAALGDLRL